MIHTCLKKRMTHNVLSTVLRVNDLRTGEGVAIQCAVQMIGLHGCHSAVFWFAEGLSGMFSVPNEQWNKAVRARLLREVARKYNDDGTPF